MQSFKPISSQYVFYLGLYDNLNLREVLQYLNLCYIMQRPRSAKLFKYLFLTSL